MKTPHPDFDAAPIQRQWRGELKNLWPCLNVAAQAASGGWVSVVTLEGIHIALRIRENGQREVVLGRSAAYTTERERLDWLRDMSAHRREFGATGWKIEHDVTKTGGPKVTFTETEATQDFFEDDNDDAA